ncbi:tetratricopeptide repeat protein 17-like isoform X1 [Sycon ciliatum]|uniref:tetratricopeptide repeat protein 17-like isoform X1 n=1 Tax=Sycon ciliatum TaxID=27933 RepID=UPI0031F628ED
MGPRAWCCGHAACTVLLSLLVILTAVSYRSDSATHWVLKQSGKIEVRPNSPYNLRKPHDVLAFVQQDEFSRRLKQLNQVLKDNSHKLEKADIEKDDDKLVEANFYKTDKDCIAAPRRLIDLDLYSSTYLPLEKKGIKMTDHLTCAPGTYSDGVPMVPDCRKPPLDFSPKSFEHLAGVQARSQLPSQPEPALHGAFPNHFAMDHLGSCLKEAIDKNSSSWVLLNIASIYWRIHGHYYQAAECLRRALHYSPPRHRDVALLSLANVLHRSQHSKDAVILLLSAIDLSPHLFIHHFTLGNVYAVNREWNLSAASYQRADQIESTIPAAKESMYAVRCQRKLEDLLTHRQQILEKTLYDLEEYQEQHLEFQNIHQQFVDNIDSKDREEDPFFGPLNSGLDSDVVSPYDHEYNSTGGWKNEAFRWPEVNAEEEEVDADDSDIDDEANENQQDHRQKRRGAARESLEQCPAGSEAKGGRKKKSRENLDQMCSAEEAIHHGKSLPNDAPEQEKDQCLVTEVTTEEIEDLRARMDWAVAGDTIDSSFSVEQAKTEFERIISSLDDADPQLIALVKERLKTLSSARHGLQDVDTDEFNLLSAYDKLSASAQSCQNKKDGESQQLQHATDTRHSRQISSSNTPETDANVGQGNSIKNAKTKSTLREDAADDDNVVMVTPDVDDEEYEVDEYGESHIDRTAVRLSEEQVDHDKPGTGTGDDQSNHGNLAGSAELDDSQESSARKEDKFKIRKCKRPRVWITYAPEANTGLSQQNRVPCAADQGRPKKISERVCHRYGEEQHDKYAVEVGKDPPPGLDLRFYPFIFDRRQNGEDSGTAQLGDVETEVTLTELEEDAARNRPKRRGVRLTMNMETDVRYNNRLPPRGRIPCMSDGKPPLMSGIITHEERQLLLNGKARDQAAIAAAVEKVANEMLNPNASKPGNLHPPKLRVKTPEEVKASKAAASSKTPSDSEKQQPAQLSDAEQHWIREQTRFIEVSTEKKHNGPVMPKYLAANISWERVYSESPRTVIAMKRRQDDTIQKVLDQRRSILSKIQLLPLRNAMPQEEVLRHDKDTRMPVYGAPEVTQEECEVLPATPPWDHFPAVYLPPEARGVNVSELLAVGLPPSHLHPNPWMPPICVHYAALPHSMKAFDHLLGIQYRDQLPMVPEPALNNLVASLVDPEDTLEEIGQRLTTAFEMSAQPAHWALFHIAGLFFRVVGNPFHALECMRRAVHFAPFVARDVPLLGMAEILHRTGQMADAVVLLRAALGTHPEQPLIHLALGNALASNGEFFQAKLHHSYVCTRQPQLEAACLAVRYDECYARREVPQNIVNAAFRKNVVPSCTLTKCELSDSPLRRKYDVISQVSLNLASPELPEIVHRNVSVMKRYFNELPNSVVSTSLKRLAAVHQERTKILAEIREMLAKDQQRIDELMRGPPAPSISSKTTLKQNDEAAAKGDDAAILSKSHPKTYRTKVPLPKVTKEACKQVEGLNLRELTSTWLSVEVKKIIIGDHIDLSTPETDGKKRRKEPFPICPEVAKFSLHMMDHLQGVQDTERFEHVNLSEPGLSQVMFGIGGQMFSLSSLAGRIDDALQLNTTSWVLHNLAGLVWRLKGRADLAIRCLRQALHFSPQGSRDIGLVSLANVMARSRSFRDALILMGMAMEISPNFVVHHFTIANILAATGNYKEAEFFYRNTLSYQSDFQPASQRLMAARCRRQFPTASDHHQQQQQLTTDIVDKIA